MARIFLSYSSEQHQLAERLAVALRGEGHVVFFDRHNIAVSDSFHRVIRRDIRRSTLMVFLISPRAVREGSYAVTELNIAQREWKVARFRVVPVVVERTRLDTLPGFLREVSLLEPSGNPVGEVTHAVDDVLRRRRREKLITGGLAGAALTLVGVLGFALFDRWDARDPVWFTSDARTKPQGQDEVPLGSVPNPGAPAWPSVGEQPVGPVEKPPEPDPPTRKIPRPRKIEPRSPAKPSATRQPRPVPIAGGPVLHMQWLDGGRYVAGAPRDKWVDKIPEPQRMVAVDGFWIGAYEVTQAQWKAVMASSPSNCELECGADVPVNHVTHEDVLLFANRVSHLEGHRACYERIGGQWSWNRDCDGYRLPTEVEWEYAARGGTTTAYAFGDSPALACVHANGRDQDRVNERGSHSDNSLGCRDGYVNLAPVGQFEPNAFGLFDMHGNVWEWVWEQSPLSPTRRLIRGGSYLDGKQSLRVSNRAHHLADRDRGSVGFRLARSG